MSKKSIRISSNEYFLNFGESISIRSPFTKAIGFLVFWQHIIASGSKKKKYRFRERQLASLAAEIGANYLFRKLKLYFSLPDAIL